jgi:ATP-dependent Clp protease ATP-binding subunit ClpA
LALQRVIQRAALHVQSSNKKSINPVSVLIAMFGEKESHAVYFLQKRGIKRLDIVSNVAHGMQKATNSNFSETRGIPGENSDPLKKESNTEKMLSEFTIDLTKKAKDGKVDPLVGREKELKR